jgi:ArsR family transcriptional regulator, arsenate/arsenite/antimonite-responsive transcriptional repressor
VESKKEQITDLYKRLYIKIPVFQALADDERLRILVHLLEAGIEGMNVTDLSAKSQLSRPAVSHHLKILKDCGIITPHKSGTQIFYVLDAEKDFAELKETVEAMQNAIAGLDITSMRKDVSWILDLVDSTAVANYGP